MTTDSDQTASLTSAQTPKKSGTRGLSAKFARLANRTAILAGNYKTFVLMLLVIAVWALTGPLFGFSANWQLFINTGTTIVTFLMVFLIQNTQNRDSMAVHLKLDEIIRAIDEADDELMRAEDETDEELADLKKKFQQVMEDHRVIKAEDRRTPRREGKPRGLLANRMFAGNCVWSSCQIGRGQDRRAAGPYRLRAIPNVAAYGSCRLSSTVEVWLRGSVSRVRTGEPPVPTFGW